MFKGSNVALVTPFKGDSLDEETYIKIINFIPSPDFPVLIKLSPSIILPYPLNGLLL